MSSWSENILQQIDNNLKAIKEKDLRFYRIDEFKRNISRVDTFSETCSACKNEMVNISEIVNNIEEAVNVPGNKRREYERLISRLSKHIQKKQGI